MGECNGELWVPHATEVYRLDWKNNRVVARMAHGGFGQSGGIFADP
jgi:hypothetical protein